jgi:hypothetical protein
MDDAADEIDIFRSQAASLGQAQTAVDLRGKVKPDSVNHPASVRRRPSSGAPVNQRHANLPAKLSPTGVSEQTC